MAKAVKNSQTGSGKKGESSQTGRRAAKGAAAKQRSSRAAQARQRAAQTQKKQGFSLTRFLRDVRVELGKVTWPTRSELVQSTLVVLVFVAIAASVIFVYDQVFSRAVDLILPK